MRRMWRMASARRRPLPDFLIIGAQKAGTTSLYSYLLQHPLVLPAERKEVHFFDLNWRRGETWYRSHFPRRGGTSGQVLGEGSALVGDASPYYLFHPHVPARVAALLPQIRIIVMLRDPVLRAYSHYRHNRRKGEEDLPFEQALLREEAVMPSELEKMLAEPGRRSLVHQLYSYLARGRYAEQLERWFAHFDRSQFLFVRSEDFFSDPQPTFSEALQFLGLNDWRVDAGRAYNQGRYASAVIPNEEKLRHYFRDPNDRLEELLSRSFDWCD